MYFRYLMILCVLGVTSAGVTEDQVYMESLAANIEQSGLLPNFAHAWREHIDSWNDVQDRVANGSYPSTWNGTWPTNGTVPTPASFNCNTTVNTDGIEYNINRIHPARIDIVAAMGASIVAGTGAGATKLLETTLQYRGLSFPIGGDGGINDTLTVPNILKKYNSRIRGWSRSISPAWFEEMASLNVAVPGATASDLDDQAKELIKRIDQWPGAKESWKLVTVFIGMNDLCEACDKRVGGKASTYGRHIKSALNKLEKGLTRTIVNLVALPPMHQWYQQLHDDPVCFAMHRYICPCVTNPATDAAAVEYNAELYKLAGEYSRVDFAVVVQPFLSGRVDFPKISIDGVDRTDQSYFAPDCFHLSRRGHAAAARALWQNMFESPGEKSSTMDFSSNEISCPDQDCPYVRTGRNWEVCPRLRTTIKARVQNLSSDLPHYNPTAYPPRVNWTEVAQNVSNGQTLKPWHRNQIQLARFGEPEVQGAVYESTASGFWIAFGVILSAAVVVVGVIGYVDLKRRNGKQYVHGERTPLLTGSNNVEQIY